MNKLKEYLNSKNLSIYRMAKDLNKPLSYFYRFQTDRYALNIRFSSAKEIADYLQITLDKLYELLA